jgi:hypothetical protein
VRSRAGDKKVPQNTLILTCSNPLAAEKLLQTCGEKDFLQNLHLKPPRAPFA